MRFGEPASTPIWLSDSSYPAPCPCGRPMVEGEPFVVGTGELGMTRIFHLSCVQGSMMMNDDEDSV